MLDDFFIRALLAGVAVALAAGPLGCFVVWRRMAYFGDATAHAAILGVAVSLALSLPVMVGTLFISLLMASAVALLSARSFASDTLLGVLAHSALAAGLVAVTILPGVQIDLMGYLFGDILAVRHIDLAIIWGGALAVLGLLYFRWSALLTATLNPELAYAAGLNPRREGLVLTLALAMVVAVAIKVVGVLLIGAMLIIPPAAARPFSRTPEQMAVVTVIIGVCAVLAGLEASLIWDTPAGPSIVCAAAIAFAVSLLMSSLRRKTG